MDIELYFSIRCIQSGLEMRSPAFQFWKWEFARKKKKKSWKSWKSPGNPGLPGEFLWQAAGNEHWQHRHRGPQGPTTAEQPGTAAPRAAPGPRPSASQHLSFCTVHLLSCVSAPKVSFLSVLLVELIKWKEGKKQAFSACWCEFPLSSQHWKGHLQGCVFTVL